MKPRCKALYDTAEMLMKSQAREIDKLETEDENAQSYMLKLHEVVSLYYYQRDEPETAKGIETIFKLGFYRGMKYQERRNQLSSTPQEKDMIINVESLARSEREHMKAKDIADMITEIMENTESEPDITRLDQLIHISRECYLRGYATALYLTNEAIKELLGQPQEENTKT